MIKLELKHHKGFEWHSAEGIHAKGFLHTFSGEYLQGQNLVNHFKEATDMDSFREKITRANGCFSVIVNMEDRCILATDPLRTFPLFYSKNDDTLSVSDSVTWIMDEQPLSELNEEAILEFLATGYVPGRETLVRDIFQVQAGEILVAGPDECEGEFYYTYQVKDPLPETFYELTSQLHKVLLSMTGRMIASLQNRTAAISLSGGFDSRLIAVLLKQGGYEKVICFTYGRKGNPEISIAREVARKLDYRWHFIEYSEDLIQNFVNDNDYSGYYQYSANCVSMFFLQDYFAVKALKERQLIPDDAILIPGHSGDLLGGSMFLKHGFRNRIESLDQIAGRLYHTKYILCRPPVGKKKRLLNRLKKTLNEKQILTGALSYSIHEDWDIKEKIAKFIVNSANVYSWFNYEYRLPFWDKELLDFCRQIPYPFKLNKKLYDQVLVDGFFTPYGISFEKEIQPADRVQKTAFLKGKVKTFLPDSVVQFFSKKTDPIFYREITGILKDNLAQQGKKIKVRGNSYNSLIVQWYIHQLRKQSCRE